MSGVALQALLEQQPAGRPSDPSLDLGRALATAVDTEMRLTISALQSLAVTEPLGQRPAKSTSPSAHESARRPSLRPGRSGVRSCWPRPTA